MDIGIKIVSAIALACTVLPAAVYAAGAMDLQLVKWTALIGTIAWFATAVMWMGRKLGPDADQVQI